MNRRTFLHGLTFGVLTGAGAAEGQGVVKGPQIGYLAPTTGRTPLDDAFDQAMKDLGYVEGRNISFVRRYLNGRIDRARAAAEELIALKPDVIVVWSPPLTSAVKATGTQIPVVFLAGGAAVELGFAQSLARPGGTMTGIAFQPVDTLLPKYLQIAKDLVPNATRFVLLVAPGETSHRVPEAAEKAAQTLKIRLQRVVAGTPEELTSALEALVHGDAQVLVAPPSALLYVHRKQVVAFAEKRHLPAVYGFREVSVDGGLASFSANLSEIAIRGATYVDKILKGAKPGDLPIDQPTKYDQKNAGALIVLGGAPLGSTPAQRDKLVELAAKTILPTIYVSRAFVSAGGLLSYGPARGSDGQLLATYIDKILRGAKPGDLPVQQPRAFDLAINLKTAKALGLTIPQSLLERADQVIE